MKSKKPSRKARARTGSQLTGIRAVAQRAGVAVSTVSRVFSGHAEVSSEMRAVVLEAAQAIGYRPDAVASSLRKGRTLSIGCIVADIANPTFAQIIRGTGQALSSHGYAMLIANATEGPDSDAEQIALLHDRRVDGLIVSVSDDTDARTLEALAGVNRPCVIADRDLPGLPNMGRVLFDHESGIFAAVATLAELGHRQLGFVGGNLKTRPTRERTSAFQRACKQWSVAGVVRSGAFGDALAEAAVIGLLAEAPETTGLISGSNQVLGGMLRALRSLKLSIPDEMSLVTCDNVPMMNAIQPQLAVVDRDLRALGREAAEMVVSMVSGGKPRWKLLPVEFRFGASCARPRGCN